MTMLSFNSIFKITIYSSTIDTYVYIYIKEDNSEEKNLISNLFNKSVVVDRVKVEKKSKWILIKIKNQTKNKENIFQEFLL